MGGREGGRGWTPQGLRQRRQVKEGGGEGGGVLGWGWGQGPGGSELQDLRNIRCPPGFGNEAGGIGMFVHLTDAPRGFGLNVL